MFGFGRGLDNEVEEPSPEKEREGLLVEGLFGGDEEDLVQDFYADLQNKVSIDQEYVSLNALELFCRKNGLQRVKKSL